MFPIIQLGSLAIQTPGLIVLATVWVALDIAACEGKRVGIVPEPIYNTGMIGIAGGLIGARLWYVGTYWPLYQADLPAIFSLNPATLSPVGGVLLGLGLVIWYVRRKALPIRQLLDVGAPALAVFAAGLALANLAGGNDYGIPTRLPWAIYLWDDYRHPTQVYDFLVALAIFAWLWRLKRSRNYDGMLFLVFVGLYALAGLLLEPLRAGGVIWVGGIRAVEVWSLAALLAALWLWSKWAQGETGAEPAQGDTANGLI